MRLMPMLRLLLIVLPFLAAGGVGAVAQPVYQQQYAPYGAPPPPQIRRNLRAYPPGYYPGKLVRPAPQSGFSLRRLFGAPEEPPPPVQRPVARPRRPAPAPTHVARQAKPKPDAATQVVVFGDALAGFAEQGLSDLYADSEDVAIVRKTEDDGGLMRPDPEEWPKSIKDVLDSGQKITLAVVMVGANDRQPLKDQSGTHDPLSSEWRNAYRQRVDAVLKLFRDKNVPVVWIGLPPMKDESLTEDLLAMNDIYRQEVERNGGTYVDIWPGFVDEDNTYATSGPDVDGQTAKLRMNDGVRFTKSGARKIAHFADTAIKAVLSGETGTATGAGEGAGSSIEAALPAPPEAAEPAALPSKPLVGPVLPLNRPEVTPDGTLIASRPKLTGDQAYPIQRTLRKGIAPDSRPGRADDFRWPPASTADAQ